MSESGAVSSDGLLALAIGTARLHPNDDVVLELAVGAAAESTMPFWLSIFANDQQIASHQVTSVSPYWSFRLPQSLLGRSDPLRLVIIGSADGGGDRADFVLHDFRLLEAGSTSLCNLPVGHVTALANHVPEVRLMGGRMAPAMFQLALPMVQRDSVLVIDAGMGYAASLEGDGAIISAVGGADGRALLPVGGANLGAQGARLTLSRDASARTVPAPILGAEHREHTIAHYLLPTLGTPAAALHRCYVFRDGWNEAESNGWCWGAADRVSFWVRPGDTAALDITCELLRGLNDVSNLSFTVNEIGVKADINTPESPNRIIVHLPLDGIPRSGEDIMCIEISGLPVSRPCDLGINDDVRTISIALVDIVQSSGLRSGEQSVFKSWRRRSGFRALPATSP
jgi:hypothetical protein